MEYGAGSWVLGVGKGKDGERERKGEGKIE
jgi:hypothetical protein